MAEFIPLEKNKYRIMGVLTEEDIERINSFKNRTTLILENTVGLSSELISKIKSDRVVFSIKGGLDYDTKEKYKEQKYVDRTFVSPAGLKNILKYFEYNERMIDPNWNEFEKAMFLYNALVVDMEYAQDYDNIQSKGTTERSLNGILYGKLVCAGFAQVYKEMLDRVGIKNYYQNQRDVHAFNVIEIDGKRYGVDVTWDNNNKNKNNGRCGFGRFGHDPEFYSRHGHQLFKDQENIVMDDNEELGFRTETKRVFDTDEEIFDLSLLSMEQLNEYYGHIASKIDERKPFRYNLQDQPLRIKRQYLPVDLVDIRLREEAKQEYPAVAIMDYLKHRNALQINPQLFEAFSYRSGYVLDMRDNERDYLGNLDLSIIGIDNYTINRDGSVLFNNGSEFRQSAVSGVNLENSNMPEEELTTLSSQLNQYLTQYLNKYLLDIIENIDTLLANYEYKPDEWDNNRAIQSGNIYTKLDVVVKCRDYLIQLGIEEQEIDNIIQRIKDKHNEIHAPYEQNTPSQKEQDLDFLSAVFDDINMIWNTMEADLERQLTEEEFTSLFQNVDYMIQLFEKYITIAGEDKFKFTDYDISKEDLQNLLNKIIQDYLQQKKPDQGIGFEEPGGSDIKK